MSCKPSIAVIAGHELPPANRRLAGSARTAVAAGDHRRNNYAAAFPLRGALARCHNATRDFVPESEWQRRARRYTVESEAYIGMADAAAGNLYDHLASPRLKSEEFVSLQTLSRSSQTVAVTASVGRQTGNPPTQDGPHRNLGE